MKRKFLLFFLIVIAVVCISLSFSACDTIGDLLDAINGTETSQEQTDDGSEQSPSDDDEQSSSGDDDEQSPSSDDEQSSSGDDDEQSPSSDDEQSPSSDDEQSSSGDDDEQSSSGDDDEQSSSGDDDEQSPSDDDEQSPSDDDEQSSSGDDDEQSSSGDESSSGDTDTEKDDGGETTASFTARTGNSSYGYYELAGETNGTYMQSLYYDLYTACETFTTNTSDITLTNLGNNSYYVISIISYSTYNLSTTEAISVWKVFYLESPMYYWLYSSCVYSTSSLYLCIDETYANYSDRVVYDAAISTMITEANAIISQQSTELEKAIAIHDYIIAKIDYAYQSDGVTPETAIWAHNITGVSSQGYGVCEAYAKTYLALCLINGLDCIIVSGYASGESHAWNLVEIDNVWYGVDCTWDDTETSTLSYTYFGMNASTLSSSRTNGSSSDYGMNYLYDLPEVTKYGIQLVTLFKGGMELGIYANIDAAFAAMTDTTADYTIELYFYNYTGTQVYTSFSTTVYIYSETTPSVNSITINGIYQALEDGYFYITYLSAESKLTLKCNLTISNFIFTATELDLGEYTLTAGGYYCRLNGVIYDSKTTETVSVKSETTGQTAIYATLNVSYYYGGALIVSTANIGSYYGSASLNVYGGTVTIGKYISANETNYYSIYLQEKGSLNINNVVYSSSVSNKTVTVLIQFDTIDEYPTLYLGSVSATVYLVISGYVSSTEAATTTNLTCSIATLGSADDFANIYIFFGSANYTSLYEVNENKEIVYKS